MDAAEAWLREHDPDYATSSKGWRDIGPDGEYVTPRNEIPWGTATDIGLLLERGTARPVAPASARYCKHCDSPYIAQTNWQLYCSDTCKQAARGRRTDYWREQKRKRRAA